MLHSIARIPVPWKPSVKNAQGKQESTVHVIEHRLGVAIVIFQAITKLDQLEIQLMTTEHPPYSTRLARFHAQAVATIEDVTSKPLAEGYALLDVTGRGAPGAEVSWTD